jgi:hypothetical protein
MKQREFRQIAHSGGRLTIKVFTRPSGERACILQWRHTPKGPSGIFSVHAIHPGIVVGTAELGGMGSVVDPGPVPGCFQVFLSSDSEGMFGQDCVHCRQYWRSGSPSLFCAYCGIGGQPHQFITDAHQAFVQQFAQRFAEAMTSPEDGEHVIDLNVVADAVESVEKPPFYYAEESQQNLFNCRECGYDLDILGRFCYCSLCGTRNDLQELEEKTLLEIRERINASGQYEACVRDAVAAFDSFVSQYVKELVRRVPLTAARRNRLQTGRFHNLKILGEELRGAFDIDIEGGLNNEDKMFAARMFARRHVYEHNGGEADAKYIEQSGDTTVRLKQSLSETQDSAHKIASVVNRMARNLHRGFHELFPPNGHVIRSKK